MVDDKMFVHQQNTEQLGTVLLLHCTHTLLYSYSTVLIGQTLKSLNEFYDTAAKSNDLSMCSPNEAEFRSYFILSNLQQPTEWFPGE
jgi:hypothetical protein